MTNEIRSENSMVATEMEFDIYSNIFDRSPRLKVEFELYEDLLRSIKHLSEDIYFTLFKDSIRFLNHSEMDPRYLLNHHIIEEIDQNHEIKSLRKKCSFKYLNSIISTEVMVKEIVEDLGALIEKKEDLKKLLKRYNKAFDAYSDTVSGELEVELETLSKEIFQILLHSNFFYRVLSKSYKEFMAIFNTIKSWGLDDGKLTTTSYDEKVVVCSKLRKLKKVRNISEMTGRFRSSASNLQRKRSKESGMEICGVEIGDDIQKALPTEKAFLSNEKTRRGFMKKYAQKELMSYKYRNNRLQSKGPIICCIDTSSSMEGELEVWSKSIAMTLMDIAFKQKREFVAILFSYKVGRVIEFNKNKINPSKIYDLATLFFGSGTNFVEPLTESIRLINTAKYKYADIIFITDGEAPLDDDFIEEFNNIKAKKEFRMITVNVSDKIEPVLDRINDTQIVLSELTDEMVDETNETIFSI